MDTETPTPPADPNAPTVLDLPSGKKVQIRSHRTLLGGDGVFALNAQSGTGNGNAEIRAALVARMATELEPGSAGTPALDGTIEAVNAQRIDDASRLLLSKPVTEGYRLVVGLSVVPDQDEWEDPTGPTRDSSGSRSPSVGDDPS